MNWKNIIEGILVTVLAFALIGIGKTLFDLHGRVSAVEVAVSKRGGATKQLVSGETQLKTHPFWPGSPDGKYQGVRVRTGMGDAHYQVKEVGTGRTVMTTQAQCETPNEVKAGLFSPDSKHIAAAYHYGDGGGYTWVGIWDIETGNLIDTKRKSGHTADLYWVFEGR